MFPVRLKPCILSLIILSIPTILYAATPSSHGRLSVQAIERVQQYKSLIREVESRSEGEIITALEKSDHPMINLQIKEAMAKTFVDIVAGEHIEGIGKKRWLYSMVALNMAYLQFGGSKSDTPLNKLILHKLKNNLPPEILDERGFHYSLE